jgi:hypothetical protein
VQGGIGTYEEDKLLREYYQVDGTGWGSPLLLVPEATTVDNDTIDLLKNSKEEDIVLSNSSPLGVRFNILKGTSGEKEKEDRILCNKPGSPCTERYLTYNKEFENRSLCTASSNFQKLKLKQLKSNDPAGPGFERSIENAMTKECLCIGLSNAALINYNLTPIRGNSLAVTICPGPNIAYFSKVVTLKDMIDHIYGRKNILEKESLRPHFFIKELELYVDYLNEQMADMQKIIDDKIIKNFQNFCQNLMEGIEYYNNLVDNVLQISDFRKQLMITELVKSKENVLKNMNSLLLIK